MTVIDAVQASEGIATETAHRIAIRCFTDAELATPDDLTGKTVQLRIGAGSLVGPKIYTAVNRSPQSGSSKGWCDVTLDETYHTEAATFDAQVLKKTDSVGDYQLQWPRYRLTFVTLIEEVPTPTPTP